MIALEGNSSKISSKQRPKATVYEILDGLAEEMVEGIKNLSDTPLDGLESELHEVRELSFRQRSPEAEYVTNLFRKYAGQ